MVEQFAQGTGLVKKKTIFDVLDAADAEDDHEERNNEIALFLKSAKAVESNGIFPDHSQPSNQINPNQSFGPTLHSPAIDLASSDIYLAGSDVVMAHLANVSVTSSQEGMKTKRGRKRKSTQDAVVSEGLRILKGLVFCNFFPNDDVAPARKARIGKALEIGATWEKDWNSSVTHIIIDKGLSYQDLLRYLKLTTLPPDVAVVNEGYPSSCLSFGQLLDPSLVQHRVKGQPQAKLGRKHTDRSNTTLSKAVEAGKAQTPMRPEEDEGTTFDDPEPVSNFSMLKPPASPPKIDPSRSLPAYSLEEAIQDVQAVQDLPLDSDDSDASNPASSSSEPNLGLEFDHSSRGTLAARLSSGPNPPWQQAFQCMQPSSIGSKQANARTIEILQQMATHYDCINDHWRTTAYRKAISALRRHPTRICTKAEALSLNTIGERLADKIEEIVQTDNLRFLQNAAEEPKTKALKTFLGIYQVGLIQASAWVAQGFRTLEDLLTNKVELSSNQRVGLEHYKDFNQRIPRAEMDKHASFVKQMIGKVESAIEVMIGGSYRRGSKDSGDIDFITSPRHMNMGTLRTIFFHSIVPRLYAANYLNCALAATNARSDSSKWHGACALPFLTSESPWRRIDFLLVPYDELGAAMIYFTGNDIFNRSMRLLARKKGMRLNQKGLWNGVEGGAGRKGGEAGKGGSLVAARDERAIFDALGVQWRETWERNV